MRISRRSVDHLTIPIFLFLYTIVGKALSDSSSGKHMARNVNPVWNDIPITTWKVFFNMIKEMVLNLTHGSIWQVESQKRDE